MKIHTRKKIKHDERLFLFEKYDYQCQMCNITFKKPMNYEGRNTISNGDIWLEIDHIIPISKGGHDNLVNKQILCNVCNSKKSNKL